jgi:hypothetical protein
MQKKAVQINFEIMGKAFREFVRPKSIKVNSTIIYKKYGVLIEGNPKTSTKSLLNGNLPNVN